MLHTQDRPDEQRLLGDTELDIVLLGHPLIPHANHDGTEGHQGDIGKEDRPERTEGQIRHTSTPFLCVGLKSYFLALSLRETTWL